ncbi:MAG: zinc-binding dehydrogenase [Candidatus Schekmanbacteria bacterium]|nr:zinc-binding dehydrogenase [Candidatus Schekmanbacteria bacterium]
MKQVWIPRIGDPSVLEVRTSSDPVPGAGEVRIRVGAAGVNFADIMARMGLYPDAPRLPAVVGYEVAGTIDAVGAGADAHRMGEPVAALVRFGGYSDCVCVPADQARKMPPGMTVQQGAAIPVVYLTSYVMLEVMAGLKAGDRVLIHAAAGGVGLAAIDLCRARGAVVYGTASPGKHDFLRERGVAYPIDYRNKDFEQEVMDLTGGEGVDIALDAIGGANWAKSFRCLRTCGRLVCFGMSANATGRRRALLNVVKNLLSVPWRQFNPITLMNQNKAVLGVNMGHMWSTRDRVAGWLDAIMKLFEAGQVRPYVDRTFAFERAGEAHEYIQDRRNVGKVLLVPEG